ncbi:hypothetical protein [Variovorax sp. 3P27G3]|jgi:hypothetical protein|uniref:hypothetical protein n=1 Tax=Variovorax sp. 3P27G3 TaxID=2502214 RepID=UPI0010F54F44|nr:hypothetical protein [Variovorax sp. 3P27G3]
MARHFRTPDITVRIPFGTTEPERIALLRAAGVPLDARGDIARGFMHERRPYRFGADTICHWIGTGDATPGATPEPRQGA